MSLTKLSLGGNYDVIYKLFLSRESLVSDIPAGDGNIEKLFLRCSLTAIRVTDIKVKKGDLYAFILPFFSSILQFGLVFANFCENS